MSTVCLSLYSGCRQPSPNALDGTLELALRQAEASGMTWADAHALLHDMIDELEQLDPSIAVTVVGILAVSLSNVHERIQQFASSRHHSPTSNGRASGR